MNVVGEPYPTADKATHKEEGKRPIASLKLGWP